MFKHSSLVIGALAFFSVGLAAASTAHAATMDKGGRCCVGYYDHNYNDKGNVFVIESLTERINAMELAIIEALRLGTGQLSGNMKEQIGADSNMANAQDDRAVVGRIEEARLDAIRAAASGSSSCNVITGALGGTGIEAASVSFTQQFSEGMSAWNTGDENMPSSQGTAAAVGSRVALHCEKYANDQDVKAGLCDAAGDLKDANINISESLFYHEDGSVSGTLPQERVDAASAFLINAINPMPTGAALQSAADTPEGRAEAARAQAEAARMSIAAETAGDILGRRTAQSDSTYVAYTKETASRIPGYQGNFDNGVSWYDFMDVRARGWYMNPTWAVSVDSRGPEQATKDIALIQSYQAYLGWETYKLLEKQNVILATMLAMQVEERRP